MDMPKVLKSRRGGMPERDGFHVGVAHPWSWQRGGRFTMRVDRTQPWEEPYLLAQRSAVMSCSEASSRRQGNGLQPALTQAVLDGSGEYDRGRQTTRHRTDLPDTVCTKATEQSNFDRRSEIIGVYHYNIFKKEMSEIKFNTTIIRQYLIFDGSSNGHFRSTFLHQRDD